MAEKYLKNNNGILQEVEGLISSSGSTDAGKIPALDNTGRLDETLMPVGIGADTASILASESLSAGDFVNIFNDGGTAKVRKADATVAGKEAHGFVLAAVSSGNNANVYFEGTNTQLSGLTPGVVYLSTTAGASTSTPPSASGNIVQKLGIAISSTAINFEAGSVIELV